MTETRPANTTELVDTHAHLTDERFSADLQAVLDRARLAGVSHVVSLATNADESAQVINLVRVYPGILPGVGIHPNEAVEATDQDWATITRLAALPSVVAIGETGLDKHWDRTPFPIQQDYFERHLRLARERNLPIVIHSRDCMRELLDQLHRQPAPIRGVLHSFTGTWDEACEALDLGLYLSFAGMITFQNASVDSLREVAARVPMDRLLVETDSPYLSPHPLRGRRNEPSHVAHTAARLAMLRGISLDDVARSTTFNARRLFALDGPHYL